MQSTLIARVCLSQVLGRLTLHFSSRGILVQFHTAYRGCANSGRPYFPFFLWMSKDGVGSQGEKTDLEPTNTISPSA